MSFPHCQPRTPGQVAARLKRPPSCWRPSDEPFQVERGAADSEPVPGAFEPPVESTPTKTPTSPALIARRSAIKTRSQTANRIYSVIDTAPETIRARFHSQPVREVVTAAARFHSADIDDPIDAAKCDCVISPAAGKPPTTIVELDHLTRSWRPRAPPAQSRSMTSRYDRRGRTRSSRHQGDTGICDGPKVLFRPGDTRLGEGARR